MKWLWSSIWLVLFSTTLPAQDYLDALRPFMGMQGSSGAESGITPASTAPSTALLGNPANLTSSSQTYFGLGLSYDQTSSTSIHNSQLSEPDNFSNFRLNNLTYLYAVPVFRGAWVWAVNLQPVVLLNGTQTFAGTDTDNGAEFSYRESERSQGSIYALSAGTAVLWTERTSVGLAVSMLMGQNTYQSVRRETDPLDNFFFTTYTDSSTTQPTYRGFSLRAGLSTRLNAALHLALSLELPAYISVSENSNSIEVETQDTGVSLTLSESHFTDLVYSLLGPWRAGLGAGFTASNMEVSVNYVYHGFSHITMNSKLLNSTGGSLDDDVNAQVGAQLQDVHELAAGLSWSQGPLATSLAARVYNHPRVVNLDMQLRLDAGVEYALNSDLILLFAYRNTQWGTNLDHSLASGTLRSVDVQNTLSLFQFGVKYIL